jgi:hypothetical protein
MDIPNIGPYASVVGAEITPKRLVYHRGYGNIVSTLVGDNRLATQVTAYNRLQPLSGDGYGQHLPVTADPGTLMLNPQSTIAWDNTQTPPPSMFQNEWIARMPGTNSAIPVDNKKWF